MTRQIGPFLLIGLCLILLAGRLSDMATINKGMLWTLTLAQGKSSWNGKGISERNRVAGELAAMLYRDNSDASSFRFLRSLVFIGAYEQAAQLVPAFAHKVGASPVYYSQLLTAASYGNAAEYVIQLYETVPPPIRTAQITDSVALAYIQRGTLDDLRQAEHLRPADLYVSYVLFKQAQTQNNHQVAEIYREKLNYFPIVSLSPTDPRLLPYILGVLPRLRAENLWSREQLLRAAKYLAWRQFYALEVESLWRDISVLEPTRPESAFYLAEIYHRRGDIDRARDGYHKALESDSTFAPALLRLGLLERDASAQVKWLAEYHRRAPDDLVGIKQLADACAQLDRIGGNNPDCRGFATSLQNKFASKVDEHGNAARLLNVPREKITLGENLIRNGSFEEWSYGMPTFWFPSDAARWNSLSNRGVFAFGSDKLDAVNGWATRWDGIALEQEPTKEAGRFRLGIRREYSIVLQSHAWYVFGVTVRTSNVADHSLTVDLLDAVTEAPMLRQEILPTSQNQWIRHYFVRRVESEQPIRVFVLVQGSSTGSVWLDDFTLRQVTISQ